MAAPEVPPPATGPLTLPDIALVTFALFHLGHSVLAFHYAVEPLELVIAAAVLAVAVLAVAVLAVAVLAVAVLAVAVLAVELANAPAVVAVLAELEPSVAGSPEHWIWDHKTFLIIRRRSFLLFCSLDLLGVLLDIF
ncbi:hypothetical protein BDZ45DRAFT_693153 [Acephala macrosclerotiorum]|nr:hypothetical protein BDZ45DRAFT_693153 [Acephala macrosclerotiorum]